MDGRVLNVLYFNKVGNVGSLNCGMVEMPVATLKAAQVQKNHDDTHTAPLTTKCDACKSARFKAPKRNTVFDTVVAIVVTAAYVLLVPFFFCQCAIFNDTGISVL